jgi:hypothetical protein
MEPNYRIANPSINRKKFIRDAGIITIAGISGISLLHSESLKKEKKVSPPEDLMREHGLLNRILLISWGSMS